MLTSCLKAMMPNSNLAKMKAMEGAHEGSDVYLKLQSAKASVMKVGAGADVVDAMRELEVL